MDVLIFEICRAVNGEIIKQVTSSWSIFIQLTYIMLTETVIIFSCYVVKATQLSTTVTSYSCNNNITLKWSQ